MSGSSPRSGAAVDFQQLWTRLEAYDLDKPGDPVPFTMRLAADCGWSRDKARRVVSEYRRFVAIGLAGGHGACPSRAVDEAWHRHLLDTRRYWGEFCREVLRQDFHHEPGRGGIEEAARFARLYRQTLADYRRLFGEDPPADIWPDADAGAAGRTVREAGGRGTLPHLRGLAPGVLALLLLAMPGCTALYNSSGSGAMQGAAFLNLYCALLGGAILVGIALQNGVRLLPVANPWEHAGELSSRWRRQGPLLGPYHLAYLTGGGQRVFEAAMTRLYAAGDIAMHGRVPLLVRMPAGQADPAEQLVAHRLARAEAPLAADAVGPVLPRIERDLVEAGLLRGQRERSLVPWFPVLTLGPLLVLGSLRLGFGAVHRHPVGMLVFVLALTAILLAMLRHRRPPPLAAALRAERAARSALERRGPPSVTSPDLVASVAVLGTCALAQIGLLDFAAFLDGLAPPPAASGSGGSSCGGGCGSGDGGGGCGGGGCGG